MNVLRDVHILNYELQLETNGGVLKTRKKGTLNNYGDVWYSPNAMTNILSLGNVTKNTESHMIVKREINLLFTNQMVI